MISIAIPSSVVDLGNKRVSTQRAGLIGRACAIFRVKDVFIYLDRERKRREGEFLRKILEYMETPQYLRKYLFPIDESLEEVGSLPPLRTPHHPTSAPVEGEIRDGFVVRSTRRGSMIDIGLQRLAWCPIPLPVRKRMTFKIERLSDPPEVTPTSVNGKYWGYRVISTNSGLWTTIKKIRAKGYDFLVGTSKFGRHIGEKERELISSAESIALVFGSPREGLMQILNREGFELEEALDLTLNFVPNQGVETIRTEEAVIVCLSILNYIRRGRNV
ncbi:RNA-binding protein [Thermococci archaeon]|nr:MAG: RNA-binding protein [Thermococci archaeon]RLF93733.1 MAG: RNA-binding protein [Thermococci archaeon]